MDNLCKTCGLDSEKYESLLEGIESLLAESAKKDELLTEAFVAITNHLTYPKVNMKGCFEAVAKAIGPPEKRAPNKQ